MKVKELIEKLKTFDSEEIVYEFNDNVGTAFEKEKVLGFIELIEAEGQKYFYQCDFMKLGKHRTKKVFCL